MGVHVLVTGNVVESLVSLLVPADGVGVAVGGVFVVFGGMVTFVVGFGFYLVRVAWD